jgi:phage shock protein A
VIRLEGKVEEAEAELDVRRGIDKGEPTHSLDRRLDALELDAEVEKRLAELKKRISAPNA